MKEIIMLFNFKDKSRLMNIKRTLIPFHIYLKEIKKEEYYQPLGYLAEIKEVSSIPDIYDGEELEDEMVIFYNIEDNKLNQILKNMRKNKIRIPYKAVITPTNQYWNPLECFAEIQKEHKLLNPNN